MRSYHLMLAGHDQGLWDAFKIGVDTQEVGFKGQSGVEWDSHCIRHAPSSARTRTKTFESAHGIDISTPTGIPEYSTRRLKLSQNEGTCNGCCLYQIGWHRVHYITQLRCGHRAGR